MHDAVAPVSALASLTVLNCGRPIWSVPLTGRHTRNHLRPVIERLLRVEGAGVSGHPLSNDLGVLVYEDGHLVGSFFGKTASKGVYVEAGKSFARAISGREVSRGFSAAAMSETATD